MIDQETSGQYKFDLIDPAPEADNGIGIRKHRIRVTTKHKGVQYIRNICKPQATHKTRKRQNSDGKQKDITITRNLQRKLTEMPPEILTDVMGYMDLGTLNSTMSTCKLLYNIGNNPKLWKQFILKIPYDWKTARKILDHGRFKKTREVHIPIIGHDLKKILKRIYAMEKLEEIRIGRSFGRIWNHRYSSNLKWGKKIIQYHKSPILHFAKIKGELLKKMVKYKKITIPEDEMLEEQEHTLKEEMEHSHDLKSLTLTSNIDMGLVEHTLGRTWMAIPFTYTDQSPSPIPNARQGCNVLAFITNEDKRIVRRCTVHQGQDHIFTVEKEVISDVPTIKYTYMKEDWIRIGNPTD